MKVKPIPVPSTFGAVVGRKSQRIFLFLSKIVALFCIGSSALNHLADVTCRAMGDWRQHQALSQTRRVYGGVARPRPAAQHSARAAPSQRHFVAKCPCQHFAQ